MALTTQINKALKRYVADFSEEVLKRVDEGDEQLDLPGMMKLWDEVVKRKLNVRGKTANAKTSAGPRKKSAYNQFMSDMLSELKEKHPDTPHKDRFQMAIAEWNKRKASGEVGSGAASPKKKPAAKKKAAPKKKPAGRKKAAPKKVAARRKKAAESNSDSDSSSGEEEVVSRPPPADSESSDSDSDSD